MFVVDFVLRWQRERDDDKVEIRIDESFIKSMSEERKMTNESEI